MMTDSLLIEDITCPLKGQMRDRRASERLAAGKEIKFFFGKICYSGTALNFSSRGIFISTEVTPPVHTKLEVIMSLENSLIKEPVTVVRRSKKGDYYRGIGVTLENSSKEYSDLIDRF